MRAIAVPLFTAALILAGAACSSLHRGNAAAPNAPVAGTQTPQRFRADLTRAADLQYLLYLPKDYSASSATRWPLMLFLHGAGERGTNPDLVTVHGPPKLAKAGQDFPFVLVSPQCPSDRTWHDDELLALLDRLSARLNIDTNRVYLTGLSMGGYGSWSLGSKYPERFAAIAPICGGGDLLPLLLPPPAKKRALNSLGIWAFHGAKDNLVLLEESQRMTNAFTRAGCKDIQLTVYPNAGHDSWTTTYNNPDLWTWFLSHHR